MLENVSKKSLIRNTWAEINLDNMKHNIKEAKEKIGGNVKLAGVLKADAYGHGVKHSARIMIENQVDILAVACITEALELRKYYSDFPILVMGYTTDEQLPLSLEKNIRVIIFDLKQAKLLSQIARQHNKEAIAHIKIDTGMNRLGLKTRPGSIEVIKEILELENLLVEGIFTHLALKNSNTDREQFIKFIEFNEELKKNNINIPLKHICDGIGMVQYPEMHLDMVRVGSFLYGGLPDYLGDNNTKPVMTLKTKIAHIKEIEKGEGVGYDYDFVARDRTIVGTLPVGYSDGYLRCIQGKGMVNVGDQRVPIIGKICMDQMMIDLTTVPNARVGDEVILIGEKPKVTVIEVANFANTNRNEILSGISKRVPRLYIENDKIIDIIDPLID